MISNKAKSWIVRGCLGTAILVLAIGAWVLYQAVSVAEHAERALHATLLVLDATNKYAQKEDKWPRSWDDLRGIERSGGMYSWPNDSAKVRELVSIDFAADPARIVEKGAERFDAIKPVGPCYPYEQYNVVAELIETLQKRVLKKGHE